MRTLNLEHDFSVDKATLIGRLSQVHTWESMGATALVNRVDGDNVVTVKSTFTAKDLPGALASRLPSGAELVETYVIPADVEEEPSEVRMTAGAAGVPVEIDALITIQATSGSSTMNVRVEVSSSIPLFGSMVEEAVVPLLRTRMNERFAALA